MQLGIDIGGTYLRYEIKHHGDSVKKGMLKSAGTGLCSFIESFLEKEKNITTVCISYAGQVRDGVILGAPHIEIDRHHIKAYIENKFNVILYIENDLNCVVLAEAASCRSKDVCAIYVGTGLGLGVISDAVLLRGHEHIAAELGHIPYKETPFRCACGKSNCIELFASGSGLAAWKKYYGVDPDLSLQALSQVQDEKAKRIYEAFIEALLHAAGTTITLFNPEILILGGGIMKGNEALEDLITSKIKAYAMPLSLQHVKIKISQKKNAALEGAFLLKDYHG